MKKLLSLFPFLVLFLFSCANFQNTNSISVSINGRDLARSAARDVAPISDEGGYFVTAAIRGDFNQSQTAFINPNDECVFVFDYVPLNSEVYAEINVFRRVEPDDNYVSAIQIYNGRSETITVSPGENYLPLALNPLMDSSYFNKSEESASIELYQNGQYLIRIYDVGVISEGLWRCGEAYNDELGPFGLEQSFTLYLTEYVYGKIKEQYSTTPVIIELPEEKAVNVKYDGHSHHFSFEGKSGYNFVVGEENNDDPPPQTYSVNITAPNGNVSSDVTENVSEGAKITLTVTPNEGYYLKKLTVKDEYQNDDFALTRISGGNYIFNMPSCNVVVRAVFDVIPTGFVNVEGSGSIGNMIVCNHEVTQSEYETYCCYSGNSPSSFWAGLNYPATYINWYSAIVYCNLRSMAENLTPAYSLNGNTDPALWNGVKKESGKCAGPDASNTEWNTIEMNSDANGYRLPTDAEWEYAASGGLLTHGYQFSGSNTASVVAVYNVSDSSPREIGSKARNELGIYDMSGNVAEWTWDAVSGGKHNHRGGHYSLTSTDNLLVTKRVAEEPYHGYSTNGFRVVRNAD